jgi:hypothetical protein
MSDSTRVNPMALDDRAGAVGLAPQMELRTGSEALELELIAIGAPATPPGGGSHIVRRWTD